MALRYSLRIATSRSAFAHLVGSVSCRAARLSGVSSSDLSPPILARSPACSSRMKFKMSVASVRAGFHFYSTRVTASQSASYDATVPSLKTARSSSHWSCLGSSRSIAIEHGYPARRAAAIASQEARQ
jgi:hypothetical protein